MPARALVLLLPFGLAASDLSCRQSLRFVYDGLPREVKVYTPRCGGDDAFANSSLPLLFAVHCFGCTFAQMEHWEAEAREYGFVLVLPLESSRGSGFNAGPCCGAAMHAGVDDVGFLRAAADRVVAQVREAAPVAFGVGWSNGGFLVALEALAAARDARPRLFRAIAPISGYQYDLRALERLSPPLPVFLHHGVDDRTVHFRGCCDQRAPDSSSAPSKPCCCGIGAGLARCEGVTDVIATYAEANRCDRGPEEARALARWFAENRSTWHATRRQSVVPSPAARCLTLRGCDANTTFCVHGPGAGHFNRPSHASAFGPAHRAEIARFFARDACALGGGTWRGGASIGSNVAPCVCSGGAAGFPFCALPRYS